MKAADAPSPEPLVPTPLAAPEIPYEARNFWAWVAYQFFYRIGWQFKMEATMMAGLISYLAPAPWVMGVFTAVNTLGRNLSPLAAAPLTDRFASKRHALILFWGAGVAVWIALTAYLWTPDAAHRQSAIWVFGVCYSLFFAALGAAGVAQGALLGRVIPAARRGGAMAAGMSLSGIVNGVAILIVFQITRGGAFPEPRNYALAFTLTSTFFVCSALALLFIREPILKAETRRFGLVASLHHFGRLARGNPDLARLMTVNVAVGILANMLQFYTGFWRHNPGLTPALLPTAIVAATLVQTVSQSAASGVLGRVADRRGNRGVICALLWIEGTIPLAAILLGAAAPFAGHWTWYLGVYFLVGVRFPVYQLLVNYLLEIVPLADHAMALGAVNTVQLVTAPAPVVLGLIAAKWGYPAAFVLGSAAGLFGAVAAMGLREPRAAGRGR